MNLLSKPADSGALDVNKYQGKSNCSVAKEHLLKLKTIILPRERVEWSGVEWSGVVWFNSVT
jgi:hypothetical protein